MTRLRSAALFFGLAGLATLPGEAAAPPFDTPAPIAFMTDLSSGATLYAKDADRRMPPASMAKMMTVYVAFDMVKHGQLKLSDMATVRPETWKKWHGPEAGSTMFLSPGEQVSVANLLYGIVTLSGNDACVVLAEQIAGTEPAFAAIMNKKAAEIGLSNSHFGTANGWPDNGVTYVTARDLAKLATATIQKYPRSLQDVLQSTRTSPGARRWGRARTSPRPIAIRCWGASPVPTGSRRATPTRRVTASPGRPSRTGGG